MKCKDCRAKSVGEVASNRAVWPETTLSPTPMVCTGRGGLGPGGKILVQMAQRQVPGPPVALPGPGKELQATSVYVGSWTSLWPAVPDFWIGQKNKTRK